MSSNFERFREALIRSRTKVALVAAYFIDRGYDVHCVAPHIPKDRHDTKSDNGDLKVRNPETGGWHRIEVKGSEKYTTDRLMKCKNLIIDKKSTYDKKTAQPDYYYLVGSEMDSALVFNVKKRWGGTFVGEGPDQMTGKLVPVYRAPIENFNLVDIGIIEDE